MSGAEWEPFGEDQWPGFRAQVADWDEDEARAAFAQWRVKDMGGGVKAIATVEQIERGSEPCLIGSRA